MFITPPLLFGFWSPFLFPMFIFIPYYFTVSFRPSNHLCSAAFLLGAFSPITCKPYILQQQPSNPSSLLFSYSDMVISTLTKKRLSDGEHSSWTSDPGTSFSESRSITMISTFKFFSLPADQFHVPPVSTNLLQSFHYISGATSGYVCLLNISVHLSDTKGMPFFFQFVFIPHTNIPSECIHMTFILSWLTFPINTNESEETEDLDSI